MRGFEFAILGERVEENGMGLKRVRRRVAVVNPVEELEGENVVVFELEKDVFDSEGCERG